MPDIDFAGLFVAGPIWRMGLLTVADFFQRKFGATAGIVSSLILIPSYFGWVAAQLVALAGILDLFFNIPPSIGLPLVAVIGTGYTLMGGMLQFAFCISSSPAGAASTRATRPGSRC